MIFILFCLVGLRVHHNPALIRHPLSHRVRNPYMNLVMQGMLQISHSIAILMYNCVILGLLLRESILKFTCYVSCL